MTLHYLKSHIQGYFCRYVALCCITHKSCNQHNKSKKRTDKFLFRLGDSVLGFWRNVGYKRSCTHKIYRVIRIIETIKCFVW